MNQTHIFNLLLIFSQRHIEGSIIYYSELTGEASAAHAVSEADAQQPQDAGPQS